MKIIVKTTICYSTICLSVRCWQKKKNPFNIRLNMPDLIIFVKVSPDFKFHLSVNTRPTTKKQIVVLKVFSFV